MMNNLIKKIVSRRTIGIVVAVLFVTTATAGAQIPAYKSWLLQGTNISAQGVNVGIGTVSPTQKLDVVGTVRMTGFEMPTGALPGAVLTSDAAGVGTWQPGGAGGGIGGSGAVGRIPKFITPVTIGNSVMAETPGGNIGISILAPANKLDVAGGVAIGAGFAGFAGPANGLMVQGNVGIGVIPVNKLNVAGGTAIGNAFAGVVAPIDGLLVQGHVGLGTANPLGRLHVQGGDDVIDIVVILPGTNTGAPGTPEIRVGIGKPAPFGILHVFGNNDVVDRVIFERGDDTLAPGTPDIQVGIGTTNPLGRLDVVGKDDSVEKMLFEPGSDTAAAGTPEVRVGIGTINPLGSLHTRGNDNATDKIIFQKGNGAAADVKVGIGTTNPTERLDIGGGNISMGYEIVSVQGTSQANATCPAGPNPPQTQKRVIGGGCFAFSIGWSFPYSDTTWACSDSSGFGSVQAYAICANIR